MSVFISYRRADTQQAAGRLADRLMRRFGRESVVIDVDTDQLGRDYRTLIAEHLKDARVVLALIGTRFLNERPDGTRRLDQPNDPLRLELIRALDRKDVLVIPVLVDGAELPDESDLPDDLRGLVYRGSVELAHQRFERDYSYLEARVARAIESDVDETETAPPDTGQREEREATESVAPAPLSPPPAAPNLALKLTPRSETAEPEEEVIWTVTVRNDGPEPLRNLVAERGLQLLDQPFDLEPGRGRRFTFATSSAEPGEIVEEVTVLGISASGAPVREEAAASIRVSEPAPRTRPARRVAQPRPRAKTERTAPTPQRQVPAGTVNHYWDRIGVAGIDVGEGGIRVGDEIRIKGRGTDFTQTIDSMQLDRVAVGRASPGQQVGVKVVGAVQKGDVIYVMQRAQTSPERAPTPAEPLAVVTHYYDRIGVAALKVAAGRLQIGDLIRFEGPATSFTQTVESMEIDRAQVRSAGPGIEVGLKVSQPVRKRDKVYAGSAGGSPSEGTRVGTVVHYWDRIGVAAVDLTGGPLALDDTIEITGTQTQLVQSVRSMQIDYTPVPHAPKGAVVSIKVDRPVRKRDVVRLVAPASR